MKKLYSNSLYNFAFFGHWRENCESLDGHFAYITDLQDFIFYKTADYGGLTWVRPKFSVPELSDSQYRYVHDEILENEHKEVPDVLPDAVKLWETLKHYPLGDHRISANIGHGDRIVHLETGETVTVGGWHYLRGLNKNYHWKLMDRDLHPEPVKLSEFIEKLSTINPFEGWERIKRPKKAYHNGDLIINGQTHILESDMDTDRYYITTPDKTTYSIRSNISAPFYHTIALLTGKVFVEYQDGCPFYYCIHDCESTKTQFPTRYRKFTKPESYHYNSRMTDF